MVTRKTPVEKSVTLAEELVIFTQHKDSIKLAASDAAQLISEAANRASKTLSEAASSALKVVTQKDAEDHDLLIELKTGMSYVRADIKDLSNGVTQGIADLEKSKAEKKEFDDLKNEIRTTREDRMRKLEIAASDYKLAMIMYTAGVVVMIGIMLLHIFGSSAAKLL